MTKMRNGIMAVMERFRHGRLLSPIHKNKIKKRHVNRAECLFNLAPGASAPLSRRILAVPRTSLLLITVFRSGMDRFPGRHASLLEGRQDTRDSMQRPGD